MKTLAEIVNPQVKIARTVANRRGPDTVLPFKIPKDNGETAWICTEAAQQLVPLSRKWSIDLSLAGCNAQAQIELLNVCGIAVVTENTATDETSEWIAHDGIYQVGPDGIQRVSNHHKFSHRLTCDQGRPAYIYMISISLLLKRALYAKIICLPGIGNATIETF